MSSSSDKDKVPFCNRSTKLLACSLGCWALILTGNSGHSGVFLLWVLSYWGYRGGSD